MNNTLQDISIMVDQKNCLTSCLDKYRSVSLRMRNSEDTRNKILSAAAVLFNVQGYKATSISDITTATGLTKGAIYRHFADKDTLETSAYQYMAARVLERGAMVIKKEKTAPDKLRAMTNFFRDYIDDPVIAGGCPVLNAGAEADDTKPELKRHVTSLLDSLQNSLHRIIEKGIAFGQLKPHCDIPAFTTLYIAALEGGILLSKLRGRKDDMIIVIKHLHQQIDRITIQPE